MDWLLNHAPTVLLVLAGALVLIGTLLGLMRGFKRAFIRFLTVLAAFFGSLFACKYFLSNTEKVLNHPWTQKLLDLLKVTFLDQLKEQAPDAYETLIGLPVAILSPIFFTLLFLVAAFVLELVSMIIGFFAGPKRSFKLLGGLIGAVQGAVFTVAILVPLCGLLTNAVSAIDTIEAEKDDRYNVDAVDRLAEYKDQMLAVTEAPIYQLVDKYAGTPICNSLMRYTVDGQEIDIKNETDNVAKLYAHSFPLIGTPFKEYRQDQVQTMYKLVDDIDDSALFPRLIAGILNAAGNAWKNGDSFLSLPAPKTSEEFEETMQELYKVLSTSSPYPPNDNPNAKSVVASDFKTLVDLMDVFEKHGVFPIIDDSDAMKDKLSNDPTLISDIRNVLRTNDRYAAVCDALERAAFKAVVAEFVNIPEKSTPEYVEFQQMTVDMANALNGVSEEDKQAFLDDPTRFIGDDMQSALEGYGVSLDDEVMENAKDLVSDALNEEFGQRISNGETITPDEIEEFLRNLNK